MSTLTVGTICYEVRSGLGLLARDFYNNGIVNRVLVIGHPAYERQDWYPDRLNGYSPYDCHRFLIGLDVLLIFENAFRHWDTVRAAKEMGVKIVLMTMYEYTPNPPPVEPDLYLCPSLLDLTYYKHSDPKKPPVIFAPVPVPRHIQWQQRNRARVFVHNAGHGGKDYRNGTPELLEAMRYVKAPIRLIIRAQPDSQQMRFLRNEPDERITVVLKNVPDEELYSTGDVFIFPEKFNGLSLPLQEAFASGMLVMATNRDPMNSWLPIQPLIPPSSYREKVLAIRFIEAIHDPITIAAYIDNWYDADISSYSQQGRGWYKQHSWDVLGPQYRKLLESL